MKWTGSTTSGARKLDDAMKMTIPKMPFTTNTMISTPKYVGGRVSGWMSGSTSGASSRMSDTPGRLHRVDQLGGAEDDRDADDDGDRALPGHAAGQEQEAEEADGDDGE